MNQQEIANLSDRISPFVRTLFGRSDRMRPQAIGTAFMVEAAGAKYVVTAGHVPRHGERIAVYPTGERAKMVVGPQFHADRNSPYAENIDLCIVRIPNEFSDSYHPWEALKLADLVAQPRDRSAVYALSGAPVSKVKVNPHKKEISSLTITHVSHEVDPSLYAEMGIQRASHLLLHLDRHNTKIGETSKVFPDPHGLSGAPIWRVDNGQLRLVGVAIEYHAKHNAILAVDISFLHAYIKRIDNQASVVLRTGLPPPNFRPISTYKSISYLSLFRAGKQRGKLLGGRDSHELP